MAHPVQVRAHVADTSVWARPSQLRPALSPSQRLVDPRTGTVFGDPRSLLRQYKMDNAWVLIFNAGQRNEGVCA